MNKKSANGQLRKQAQFRLRPVYAAVLLAFAAQTAQANPTGASVVNGSAGFATSGNTLTVTNTPGTIINWQGFSIGSNEITRFAQQSASSTVLNRVTGNDPSNILGTLQSNGRVFLVNPHGIVFGAGAVVDVAGLVASTINLSDADFKAGNYHFTQVPGAANISNAGSITAQDNGQIYLIAPNVENTGVITAPNGEILLAAGYSVDLVSTDDPNLRVNITAPAGNATNIGQLIASSGSLGLFGTVVSNSGIVNADSATMQGGKIVFKASQTTELSGTVSANGTTGGSVSVLGDQVGIMDGATISADGTQGGGTVLIGGDAHGANPDVQNAQLTYVAPTATISADATQSGNGGKVVVWSDKATQFGGNISARGGAASGNGGWVEVSGKQWLGYAGLVNTTAAHGLIGSLLLDPMDITISNAADTVTMIPTPALGGTSPTIFADATALTTSNLKVLTLTTQLGLSSVTVDTTSALGAGTGNITVQNAIAWSSDNSLTLNATGSGAINVNANITNTTGAGGLSLQTGGGNINIGANITLTNGALYLDTLGSGTISMTSGALNVNSFTLNSGTWKQVSAVLPVFTASTGFNIIGGTFIRALGGDGSVATPFQLADIYGVQGINGGLGLNYVLANNIDAAVTQNWHDGQGLTVGFVPIGYNSDHWFSGQFDGQNHTISNLYINAGSQTGLFGYVSGGTISKIGLLNASVTGTSSVGGLVGYDSSGDISDSYVQDSSVSGATSVGGLVGHNDRSSISGSHVSNGMISGTGNYVGGLVGNYSNSAGGTISNSFVDLLTTVTGASYVGGLVGNSDYGSIRGSHVDSVSVTGSGSYVGGLVGYNHSSFDGGSGISITNSYVNKGTVSGASSVGGLVGYNTGGNISSSQVSSGTVTGGSNVGGLVGYNSSGRGGEISGSSVTSSNVHGGTNVGGLVGYNGSGSATSSGNAVGDTITGSYVSGGTVTATGNYAGGLVGYNLGTINKGSNATGVDVSGASSVGGLVGFNGTGGSSSGSYSGSTIIGSYVSGGSVTASGDNAGGLVGSNEGNVIDDQVYTPTVSGSNSVGGLVGLNGNTTTAASGNSTISGSYVSGGTVAASGINVGGLVGTNSNGSSISNSHVIGSIVNSTNNDTAVYAGGLVGNNSGSISGSYASSVRVTNIGGSGATGAQYFGGLVGDNSGSISSSYASNGSVIGSGGSAADYFGGLAGNNSGTIDTSFVSNGTVNGADSYVGGLVGYNSGTISNTYASGGIVTGTNDVGGLVGYNTIPGSIGTSYASVAVLSNGSYGGGLVGVNYGSPSSISASFWNTTVAGVSSGVGYDPSSYGGAVGMNDTDMKTMANFTSATTANGGVNPLWDFTTGTVWHMTDGLSMPLLPFSPLPVAVAPNVIGEIVDITNQHEKPKPEDLVVADNTPGTVDQSLPVCN